MNIQILDTANSPVGNVKTFKEVTLPSSAFGIATIAVTDAEGTQHLLKINPSYMGGGFAYFLTHTGMGRGQMTRTTLEELVKENGIIDTFMKEAGVKSGGRRKQRKAGRKTRKTKRR